MAFGKMSLCGNSMHKGSMAMPWQQACLRPHFACSARRSTVFVADGKLAVT